jgi:spore germination protein YaaH
VSLPARFGVALLVVILGVVTVACGDALADPIDDRAGSSAAAATPTPVPTPVPVPKHEVYGFVPYWEMDDGIADHLATTELTTLALFSVTHRRTGELADDQQGWRRITSALGRRLIDEAHARGTRVELVYTSFGAQKNERFYTEPDAQARWIDVLVERVVDLGLDGVNVDVEGLPVEYIPDYGAFVGRLRDALRAVDPDATVSVATQANGRGASMAGAAAAAGADRIFLMGYDYRYEGSNVGASAPLDRLDGNDADLAWSLDRYWTAGVPVERTLLGLPLYGVTWPVDGPELMAPAVGSGNEWVPRRNLAVFEAPGFAPTYESVESVEFYAVERDGQWHAVYFDSPRSLTPKLALADERGLAGAGFWAIGYERGLPDYTDLISTFRAGEIGASSSP